MASNDNRQSQILAYTSWVNAQLKKKPGRQLVTDLVHDMQDGTAFADLIEVVAGETLSGIVCTPSTKKEMLQNIEKVIGFMTQKNIRMHVTQAEDIVGGRINSIMRLVLALAAHYKPNSVRESRHRSSLTRYAQSAALKLAEARREASAVVHRPVKPDLSFEGSQSDGKDQSLYAMQKSASQDFLPGYGDARYRALASSYTNLSKEHSLLQNDYSRLAQAHDEVLMEMKLLKKAVLLLQHLLLGNKLTGTYESGVNPDNSSQVVCAEEMALLSSRLLYSEETQKDIKDELSKVRQDCLRRQGAEAGLQQLVLDQQNVVMRIEADLMKASLENQMLEKTKLMLEEQVARQQQQIADLTKSLSYRSQEAKTSMHADGNLCCADRG